MKQVASKESFTSYFVIAVIDPRIKTRVVSTYLTSISMGKTGISMAVNKVDGSVVGVSWAESLVIFDAYNTPRIKRPSQHSVNPQRGKRGLTTIAHETTSTWVSVFDIEDTSSLICNTRLCGDGIDAINGSGGVVNTHFVGNFVLLHFKKRVSYNRISDTMFSRLLRRATVV